jgi:hypothetical protein
LSDIPGKSYYILTGIDEHGLPKMRCVRGTSALEGFHQKIRQVLRGFHVSPRYGLALLHEFVYRWNLDIEINVCGLPDLYRVYETFRFEDEQEATRDWGLNPPAFDKILATRDFADTKEWFGFIQPLQQRHAQEDDRDGDVQVDPEIEAVAAELECDDGLPDSREKQLGNGFPAGSRWLAHQLNTARPFGPVSSPAEKSFFESNYLTFQSSAVGRDADSFSFIDWSLFALFWNNWLADEDRGKHHRTDMVNKTSGDLQKYYKLFCRLNNSRLTMEGTRLQQRDFRISLRSPSRSAATDFPEAQPRPATLPPPRQPASAESPQQLDHRVRVPAFGRYHASAVGDSDNAEASSAQPHKRVNPRRAIASRDDAASVARNVMPHNGLCFMLWMRLLLARTFVESNHNQAPCAASLSRNGRTAFLFSPAPNFQGDPEQKSASVLEKHGILCTTINKDL